MKQKIILYTSCLLFTFSAGVLVHVFWDKNNRVNTTQNENITESIAQDFSQRNDTSFELQQGQNVALQSLDFSNDEKINTTVYGMRNKAVVNVNTEVLAYSWFFEPIPQEGGVGSGSIIDTRGYILTNYHVIENATKVFITLWDKERVDGEIIGYDVENDLAVIKIDPNKISGGKILDTIPFGNSNTLQVGQKVLAIGNPFAFDRTLTTGIVSGLGRPIRSSRNIILQNMIQTDAAINPGNSGGPLLNTKGELIGVNTLIYSPSRGSVGVGFAVPSETVKRIVQDIIEHGKVQRGWISWQVQSLFPELVEYANMPVKQGLLVLSVDPQENASEAGIRGGSRSDAIRYGRTVIYLGGDIITKINDVEVLSIASLLEALEKTRPNEKVTLEYYRGKKKYTTNVVLDERPADLKF